MLAAREFTVGTLADAEHHSLVLPRTSHELPFLIGNVGNEPAAICLDGKFKFHFFECSDNKSWRGLIIPNIYIEADETTLFDPQDTSAHLGTLVRSETFLVVYARTTSQPYFRPTSVNVETDLPSVKNFEAGFSKWRIVTGEGLDKRVLFEIDTGQERKSSI